MTHRAFVTFTSSLDFRQLKARLARDLESAGYTAVDVTNPTLKIRGNPSTYKARVICTTVSQEDLPTFEAGLKKALEVGGHTVISITDSTVVQRHASSSTVKEFQQKMADLQDLSTSAGRQYQAKQQRKGRRR